LVGTVFGRFPRITIEAHWVEGDADGEREGSNELVALGRVAGQLATTQKRAGLVDELCARLERATLTPDFSDDGARCPGKERAVAEALGDGALEIGGPRALRSVGRTNVDQACCNAVSARSSCERHAPDGEREGERSGREHGALLARRRPAGKTGKSGEG